MSAGQRPPSLESAVAIPTYRGQPAPTPADFGGTTPVGDPVTVTVLTPGRWTLLLFLGEECDGCRDFWDAATDPVGSGLASDEHVVTVVRAPGASATTAAARGALVVCAPAAFPAYGVSAAPFFSLVDGSVRSVVTEGLAWGVAQVAALVASARRGDPMIEAPRLAPGGRGR